MKIKVELKNDKVIEGEVESVDKHMNILLHNATEVDLCTKLWQQHNQKSQTTNLDSYYIAAKTIRYIHLPKHFNAAKHVTSYMSLLDRLRKKSLPAKRKKQQRYEKERKDTQDNSSKEIVLTLDHNSKNI